MATVVNSGIPGSPMDKSITPKNLLTPFRANSENALQVAVTTTSTAYQLPRDQARPDDCIRFWNSGTVPVRFRFGSDNTAAATLADKAIAPGSVEIIRVNPGTTFIALIAASATTLELSCGSGI